MKFNHIAQVIAYVKETGDPAALSEYTRKKTNEAAKRLMPVFTRPMSGDGIYFLIAYAEAFLDVTKASMSKAELDLIESIKKGIQITVVKTAIPLIHRENDDDEELE